MVRDSGYHHVIRWNVNLRTRIKRLVRRTIYYFKTTILHDPVIGVFINRNGFRAMHLK